MTSPTGRDESEPHMQNLPGTPAHQLERGNSVLLSAFTQTLNLRTATSMRGAIRRAKAQENQDYVVALFKKHFPAEYDAIEALVIEEAGKDNA